MNGDDYTIAFVHTAISRTEVQLHVGNVLVRTWPVSAEAEREAADIAMRMRAELERSISTAVRKLLQEGLHGV